MAGPIIIVALALFVGCNSDKKETSSTPIERVAEKRDPIANQVESLKQRCSTAPCPAAFFSQIIIDPRNYLATRLFAANKLLEQPTKSIVLLSSELRINLIKTMTDLIASSIKQSDQDTQILGSILDSQLAETLQLFVAPNSLLASLCQNTMLSRTLRLSAFKLLVASPNNLAELIRLHQDPYFDWWQWEGDGQKVLEGSRPAFLALSTDISDLGAILLGHRPQDLFLYLVLLDLSNRLTKDNHALKKLAELRPQLQDSLNAYIANQRQETLLKRLAKRLRR